MKLTIRGTNGIEKVFELNKDLSIDTLKGQQYIFSNGFKSYTMNFNNNQESVVLVFDVDGKSYEVTLNGIVPFLQDNTPNMKNPTALIINKNISDNNFDALMSNDNFNGSEIIDRLDTILTNPVQTGNNQVELISNFQALVDSLGDTAANGESETNTNIVNFNSILNSQDPSQSNVIGTDEWGNINRNISTIPVDPGTQFSNPSGIEPEDTVYVRISVDKSSVVEGGNLTFTASIFDRFGNPVSIPSGESIIVNLDWTSQVTDADIVGELPSSINISNGNSGSFTLNILDDYIAEGIEPISVKISTVVDPGNIFENIVPSLVPSEIVASSTVVDESVPGLEDTIIVNIVDNVLTPVDEGGIASFPIELRDNSGNLVDALTDVTITLNYTGTATNGDDYNGVTTFIIPAGSNLKNLDINTLIDSIDEPLENVNIQITNVSGGGFENISIGASTADFNINNIDELPKITINDVTVNESDGSMIFIVKLNTASTKSVTVDYSTEDGTAKNVEDYINLSGTLTFAPGETSKTITIDIVKNNIQEKIENFTLDLKNPVNATIVNDGIGTIVDTFIPKLTVGDATIEEGGNLSHNVILSTATTNTVTYDFSLTGNTATVGADFTVAPVFNNGVIYDATTHKITVPAGISYFTVTYPTIDDVYGEVDETTTLTIGGSTGVGTIIDDTRVGGNPEETTKVSLSGDTSVNEGATATYVVSVENAPTIPLTVDVIYTHVDTNSGDIVTSTTQVTIPVGQTTKSFTVATIDDTIDEKDEVYNVKISNPVGGGFEKVVIDTVKDDVNTTIIDNDINPILTVGDATTEEGNNLVHTVLLNGISPIAKLYDFSLTGNTAEAGTDFITTPSFSNGIIFYPSTGKILVPPNTTSFTVTYSTVDDTIEEGNETTKLTINGSTGVGNIIDNDAQPKLTVGNVTVEEGNTLVHSVIVNGVSSVPETYSLSLTGVSATEGIDFSNSLSFTNGVTYNSSTGKIVVPVGISHFEVSYQSIDDVYRESNEITNLTIDGSTGVGIIEDDTKAGGNLEETTFVSIKGSTSIIEGNNATYTVTTSNPPVNTPLTVDIIYSHISTLSGDIVTNTTQVTIPVGSSSTTFNVLAFDDNITESSEVFNVSISNPQGGGFEKILIDSSKDNVNTKIIDNDIVPAPIYAKITVDPGIVEEEQTLTYTVKLFDQNGNSISVPSGQNVKLGLSWTGQAVTDHDIVGGVSSLPNNVTISAGNSQTQFTVEAKDDYWAEAPETIVATISSIIDNGSFVNLTTISDANAIMIDDYYVQAYNSDVKVSEEGLSGANKDSEPNSVNDSTDDTTANGRVFRYIDSFSFKQSNLELLNNANIKTADDSSINWTVTNDKIIGTAANTGQVAIEVKLVLTPTIRGYSFGNYEVKLFQALKHSDASTEDVLKLPRLAVDGSITLLNGRVSSSVGYINVFVEDDSPLTQTEKFEINENSFISSSVATNDSVGADGLGSFDIESKASNGTVIMDTNGNFKYTPTKGYVGVDSFKYTLTDADGDTSVTEVSLTIKDINMPQNIVPIYNELKIEEDTVNLEDYSLSNKNLDIINLENGTKNTVNLKLQDVVDLTDSENKLEIKGELQDKVTFLDESEWINTGKESIGGVSYDAYIGSSPSTSMVKLLIEDDIINPDL